MSILLSLFGNGVLGSLFGSLFAWLNRREERAELSERNRHDEAMLTAQNIQALALADKARAQTQTAGEQAVASKEADAFVASQSAATISETTSNSIWVNVSTFIRGVIRPLITSYLLAIATYFGYNVGLLVQGLKAFDNAALFTLYAQVINEVFFLTNLAVSWWFGARGSSPRNPFITSK